MTSCKNGHPRTKANIEYVKSGVRRCKPCHRARMRESYARKKAKA